MSRRSLQSLLALSVVSIAVSLASCGTDDPALEGAVPSASGGSPGPIVALSDAAAAGSVDEVRAALDRGAEPGAKNADGRTALMFAAFDGHTETVRVLLDAGAPVDARDADGRTALMYASSGPFAETVATLLAAGADPDIADTAEGWTALMFAAGEGHREVVETLLRFGADRSVTDTDGDTAGDHASARGHDDVVSLLRSEG